MFVRSFLVWIIIAFFLCAPLLSEKSKLWAPFLFLLPATITYLIFFGLFVRENPELFVDGIKWTFFSLLISLLIGLASIWSNKPNALLSAAGQSMLSGSALGAFVMNIIFLKSDSVFSMVDFFSVESWENSIVLVVLSILLWFLCTGKNWHKPQALFCLVSWACIYCLLFACIYLIQFQGI